MATPSITMIPSGYKAQKVYSVLPTNGDGDFTFDRNNIGTRVNKNGLIEQVETDIPRLDYSDGSCPSLLLEPASTNLAEYSEDFSQWDTFSQGSGTTPIVTLNNSISPDGANNATRLQCSLNGGSTSSDRSYIKYGGLSTTPFLTTKSLYIKNNQSTEVVLYIGINNSADTITIPANSPFARYEVSNTNINNEFRIGIQGGYLNSDSIDIDIWGAQLEEQPYATSYIPTTSGTASRSADSSLFSGDLSNYINSTAGVYYTEIKFDYSTERVASTGGLVLGSDNSFPSPQAIEIAMSEAGAFRIGKRDSSFTQLVSLPSGVNYKVAVRWDNLNISIYVNGVEEATSTFSSTDFKYIYHHSGDCSKHIKGLIVFKEALTDQELTDLTTI